MATGVLGECFAVAHQDGPFFHASVARARCIGARKQASGTSDVDTLWQDAREKKSRISLSHR